jgi:serine/threonine protein kinase
MDKMHEASGSILDERYRLIELLGEGGSGSTYRAVRLADEAVVAIKVLSLHHLKDWKQLELFEREAQILSQLNHPQIPRYIDYFHVDTPTDRAFYIVQQLAPGQPLNALIQSGWHGTEAEIKSIALQLLEILQYLQAQSSPLIHRDIKPHNIVRSDDGTVFLVDFGAVQATYNNTLMKGATVAGTYGYMAPEQFRGRAIPASDLYGLGATVLYLLTHRSPADLPQERLKVNFRSHVSIGNSFADWLETMLEPDEADRFTSANQSLKALNSNSYRRANLGQKNSFPWRGVAAALAIFTIGLPLFHQYRYAFLTAVGLQPRNLCQSIERGDSKLLNDYLNYGGSTEIRVNFVNNNSLTASGSSGSLLNCAIAARKIDIVKNLLNRGASVVAGEHPSALQQVIDQFAEGGASKNTDLKLLEALVSSPNNIEAMNASGESALFIAVRKRKVGIVQKLLQLGANTKIENEKGNNLVHALAWNESTSGISDLEQRAKVLNDQPSIDILKMLIDAGVDLNKANNNGDRPLHNAIRSYNNFMVEKLLNRGVDIHTPNTEGRTLLMMAIDKANMWSIDTLLNKGAKVNSQDANGLTPITILIQSNEWESLSKTNKQPNIKLKAAHRLFEMGADPNLRDKKGSSSLHSLVAVEAAKFDDKKYIWATKCFHQSPKRNALIDLWIAKKANPNAVNNKGETSLHLAYSSMKIFKQLVDAGGDPLRPDRSGHIPLALLASNKGIPEEIVNHILKNRKNINAVDANGDTILHRVMEKHLFGRKDRQVEATIALLVEMGADMNIKNKAGKTPLTVARAVDEQRDNSKSNAARAYINQCKIEVDRQLKPTTK